MSFVGRIIVSRVGQLHQVVRCFSSGMDIPTMMEKFKPMITDKMVHDTGVSANLKLTDSEWTLDLRDDGTIKSGADETADITLDMKNETFLQLIDGSTTTAAAYMSDLCLSLPFSITTPLSISLSLYLSLSLSISLSLSLSLSLSVFLSHPSELFNFVEGSHVLLQPKCVKSSVHLSLTPHPSLTLTQHTPMPGQLKLEGNIMQAMKLSGLFKSMQSAIKEEAKAIVLDCYYVCFVLTISRCTRVRERERETREREKRERGREREREKRVRESYRRDNCVPNYCVCVLCVKYLSFLSSFSELSL
eukprot:sb/3467252/